MQTKPPNDSVNSNGPNDAASRPLGGRAPLAGIAVSARNIALRFGRSSAVQTRPGAMLRLTRRQRILLREGLADLREMFADSAFWEEAADEAYQAEAELGIDHLGAFFCMWTSSMAALAHGAWWLLMPGCGAPVLQHSVCGSLEKPFLERREEYGRLRAALDEGKYTALAKVLERAERIRCMLALHVRSR